MEGKGSIRAKTSLATKPWWGPSVTTTKTIPEAPGPKNNLSASKWATTTQNEKKITPLPTVPKENIPPVQEPTNDAGNSDHTDDTDPDPVFSFNLAHNYKVPANSNSIHSRKISGDAKNLAFQHNSEAPNYIWAPQQPVVHDNTLAISYPDTALDDDGDVVMMDLDDPHTIQKIAEFTRNERQAEKTYGYADLKPGLRPIVPKPRITKPSCLLVIDTSFILSHLQLVDNLVNSHPRWNNVVVLPWATIQELDGLKKSLHRPGGTDVGKLARSANNWAFGVFSRLDPGVWGQATDECENSNIRGDAAILDCCRYFSTSYHTILLSNDRNLCVQAMIHNIKTVTIIDVPHTAEAILTHILGNPANITGSIEPAPRLQSPPPVNPTNLTYNPAFDYTPLKSPSDGPAVAPVSPATHKPPFTYMQPTYGTVNSHTQIIQPAFYPTTPQNEINYLPYGTKEKNTPHSTIRNGLEVSIHACRNVAPRYQYRTQAINIVKPPLRMTKPSLEPKTTAQAGRNDAGIKGSLNNFLQGVSAELVVNLVPLLKRCARDKLAGPTDFTLEALNCYPEEQVRSVIDLEQFLQTYWASVFSGYLPSKHGHIFKNGELNRRWSEWIYWTEFSEPGAIAPKMKEVKRWIEEWDFIWKRILPGEVTERQIDVNMNTVDRWRTALLGVGLAVE